MKQSTALVLLMLSILFTGCKSPAAKINQVNTGMTKAQVVELLGMPRDTTAAGDEETLRFKLLRYRPPIRWPIYEEYLVKLTDGHVTAFGKPRDLARALPKSQRKDEKTINLNVNSSTSVAPVQPNLNITP